MARFMKKSGAKIQDSRHKIHDTSRKLFAWLLALGADLP
jgi:hypothetical protein